MAPDAVPIGDWLHQGTSDPDEVANRYDEWAKGYDDDLASWSYQAPAVVAATVVSRHPEAESALDVDAAPVSWDEPSVGEGSRDTSSGSTSRKHLWRSLSGAAHTTRSSARTFSSHSLSSTTALTHWSVWA